MVFLIMRQLSASRRREIWSNTVIVSRQQQQNLLSRKKEKEGEENEKEELEGDRLLIPSKRYRKKTFIGKMRRKRAPKKKGGIKKTNKLVVFIRNRTPSQRQKIITACIIAGIKITTILFLSLL